MLASQPADPGTLRASCWSGLDHNAEIVEDEMSACSTATDTFRPWTKHAPLVIYTREGVELHYGCRCVVRQFPSFREARVCRSHAHWKIEADLIRYL